MVETLSELVEHLRSEGFNSKQIQRILYREGFSHMAVAEAMVPPRSMEERIFRLRESGASLRTIAGIPGMPPKSTLHLMVSDENRRKHNERFNTYLRKERMKDEQLTALLMALESLTTAVKSVAVKLDTIAKK